MYQVKAFLHYSYYFSFKVKVHLIHPHMNHHGAPRFHQVILLQVNYQRNTQASILRAHRRIQHSRLQCSRQRIHQSPPHIIPVLCRQSRPAFSRHLIQVFLLANIQRRQSHLFFHRKHRLSIQPMCLQHVRRNLRPNRQVSIHRTNRLSIHQNHRAMYRAFDPRTFPQRCQH